MENKLKCFAVVLPVFLLLCGVCFADVTADIEQCQNLYDVGQYDEAIEILSDINTTDPALTPKVLKLLGHCYSERRMCEKGIECYSKLLISYPDSVAPNREVKRWMMECYLEDYQTDKALVKIASLLLDYPKDSAEHHYFTGRRHHLRNEYIEAAAEYEKATELNTAPKDDPIVKDTKHRLIECYLAQGEREKADNLFQKTLKEYPDDIGTLHFITGRQLYENGDYDGATAELEQAITLNKAPKAATITKHIRRWRMVSYITKGNLHDALAELRIIMADYPKEVSTFIVEEWPRWQDRLPYAIEELRKAVEECTPGSNSARYLKKELLYCYVKTGDEVKIYPLAKAIVDEFPEEAANYLSMVASWHARQGKPEEAETDVLNALDLCSGQKSDLTRRISWQVIDFYRSQHEWTKIIPFVLDMLQDYPEDTLALESRLIEAYLDIKQYEQCISVCKDMVFNYPEDKYACIDALTKLAECMYALGRGEEAIAFQNEFFSQRSDREQEADWVRCRTAYYAEKDYAKAVALLDKLALDYPDDPLAYDARVLQGSTTLWYLNKPVEARAIYTELLSRRPDAAEIKYQLAYCSYREKDYAAARDAFQLIYDTSRDSKYRAGALYMAGDCRVRTGDAEGGRKNFQQVIDEFPNSDLVQAAAARIATMTSKIDPAKTPSVASLPATEAGTNSK